MVTAITEGALQAAGWKRIEWADAASYRKSFDGTSHFWAFRGLEVGFPEHGGITVDLILVGTTTLRHITTMEQLEQLAALLTPQEEPA